MSNLVNHALAELRALGMDPDSTDPEQEYNTMAAKAVMELIKVFSEQGHSGFSAAYVAQAFKTLADFKPLGPLTGEDSEWIEVGEGVWQNKRCSRVFKSLELFDGQAYDLDGRIFQEEGGGSFTNFESRVPVTFPYIPHTEYVKVPKRSEQSS